MRIAYVVYGSPWDQTGVPEKVEGWVRAMRRVASVMAVWVVANRRRDRGSDEGDIGFVVRANAGIGRFLAAATSGVTLTRCLQRQLSAFQPDVIYLRHPLYRPGLSRALRSVAPYLLEVNGDPYPELVLQGRRVVAIADRVLGKVLFEGAAGFVGVTQDSVRYALARAAKPAIVIANGIDCDKVSFLSHSPSDSMIHVAYVGSPSVYDGLDRLWEGIRLTPSCGRKLVVHLIGPAWDRTGVPSWVRAIAQIRTYGYVASEALGDIFANVDIAIGPLGLHRRGLKEACNLKTRRYLAHGIPIVLASDDPDLQGNLPFVMRVSPDDTPIDVEKLIEFAEIARQSAIRRQARAYAETYMSWDSKAPRLLKFIRETLNGQWGGS